MASAGLAYPERFYAAANYAGFGEGLVNSDKKGAISRFSNDVALLLYGLFQQATVGPCSLPKPKGWNPVESSKWTSWNGLGNMAQTEAMRLFVKILEEEEPAWYSRVPDFVVEPVVDVEMNNPASSLNTDSSSSNVSKTIPGENGVLETQDKDVILEGFESVGVYDKWVGPTISGQVPKARYEHGAAIVQDKMYVFGGNHNGRYLNDLQVLDLKTLAWSKVESKTRIEPQESESQVLLAPCAGHSLIAWGNKLLSVAGHAKDLSETVTVKEFDLQTSTWSFLKTYGKPPVSRGGQSVNLVGSTLVMFGGEDKRRSLLNDLHILDLETMTWDEIDAMQIVGGIDPSGTLTILPKLVLFHAKDDAPVDGCVDVFLTGGPPMLQVVPLTHGFVNKAIGVVKSRKRSKLRGTPPSPRSHHVAAVHAKRYLLIFGGGSHATCFNDLHVLDLQSMEWTRPRVPGTIPSPRAGHAGVTVGENWFMVGGGDNQSGALDTVVLNMSTLTWSVVTTVQGRVPLASEGLSLLVSSYAGEDILISFGGYNGRYSNEVNVLKPSHKSTLHSKMDGSTADSVAPLPPTTHDTRDVESETTQGGKIREICMDNAEVSQLLNGSSKAHEEEQIIATLKDEKETLEAALAKEQLLTLKLKQGVAEVETRNTETSQELQSVRGQLAAEQSRCFKLEVDVAELRQKLQSMEALQKEVELLRRQKLASEQAAVEARNRQSSGGLWGWLSGPPPDQTSNA